MKLNSDLQERIDLRALKVWRIQGIIEAIILGIVVTTPTIFLLLKFNWPDWILAVPVSAAILYGTIEAAALSRLRWEQWRYRVSEEEIDLKRGIWIIKRTLIPMNRVQHVDTRQGILMRHYGLATVTISTAAGTHEIPALSEDAADRLRDRIACLARTSENVI